MWYYRQNDQNIGPIPEEQLRQLLATGQVTPSTYVWTTGMPDWTTIANTAFATTKPPSSPVPVSPPVTDPRLQNPYWTDHVGQTVTPVVTNTAGTRSYINPTSRATWTLLFCGLEIFISIIAIVCSYFQYQFLIDLESGRFKNQQVINNAASTNDQRMLIVGLIQITVAIIYLIFYCVWVYRVNSNIHAMGAKNLQFTPGWSVGWYFIPIASLWKPFQGMSEIWRASKDPQQWQKQSSSMLLVFWWLFFLSENIIGQVLWRLPDKTIPQIKSSTIVGLIGDVIGIVATIFTIMIVRTVTKWQVEYHRQSNNKPGTSNSSAVSSFDFLNNP